MSAASTVPAELSLWQVFYSLATHLGRDATLATAVLDEPTSGTFAPSRPKRRRPPATGRKVGGVRPGGPAPSGPPRKRPSDDKAPAPVVRQAPAPAPAAPEPQADDRLAHPDQFHYSAVIWIGLIHVGALAAPFFFSWTGLAVFMLFQFLTGIGVTLGYHRLLTHNSFQTFPIVRRVLAVLGALSGEGPPLFWVSYHRQHHAFSDQEHDPHSPRDGKWWAHMLWLGYKQDPVKTPAHRQKWVPDLLRDPFMRSMDATFIAWHVGLGLAIYGAGYAVGGWWLALSWLTWGMFARLVVVLHGTWLVNSACHMWGYRNHETTDDSYNNPLVAVVTYGEGWHNNHHALPRRADHGQRWWEVDVTYRVIRLMEAVGLVWNVHDHRKAHAHRIARPGKATPAAKVGAEPKA